MSEIDTTTAAIYETLKEECLKNILLQILKLSAVESLVAKKGSVDVAFTTNKVLEELKPRAISLQHFFSEPVMTQSNYSFYGFTLTRTPFGNAVLNKHVIDDGEPRQTTHSDVLSNDLAEALLKVLPKWGKAECIACGMHPTKCTCT